MTDLQAENYMEDCKWKASSTKRIQSVNKAYTKRVQRRILWLRLYHAFNGWFDRFLPKHRYIVEEIESPTAVYLGIMRHNGIPVDLELMGRKKAETEAEMERIRNEISFIIGDVPIGANCSTVAFKKYLFKDLGLPEREWLKPVLQIHDELTFVIPEDRLGEAVAFIKECMEQKPFPEFDLPLVAEASAGRTFGTMEDLEEM